MISYSYVILTLIVTPLTSQPAEAAGTGVAPEWDTHCGTGRDVTPVLLGSQLTVDHCGKVFVFTLGYIHVDHPVYHWLVVWNIFYFCIYWVSNHPN